MVQLYTDKNVHEHYKLEEQVGEGAFSVVQRAVNLQTGQIVAVKIIEKGDLEFDEEQTLMMEMDILANIDHPSVVKLLELFDDGKTLYLIMEYMAGGELFDRIVQKEAYSEAEAMLTIRPILDAVRYCHELDIIHRDLKPENLLYETEEEHSDIKVTDFGVGRFLDGTDMASTAVGTPSYMAPEVWKGQKYGKKVDVWAVGVIVYIMLCGFPPFFSENNAVMAKAIEQGNYEFPSPYWDNISGLAKDFIKCILVVDPEARPDAEMILTHPWLSSQPKAELPEVPMKLKEFNARKRLRKAATVIIALNRITNKVVTAKNMLL